MKTAEDYWQEACSAGAGALVRLPIPTQNVARLTFLGGFAACLDVLARAAEMPEAQADAYLRGLFDEVETARNALVAQLQVASGGTLQ